MSDVRLQHFAPETLKPISRHAGNSIQLAVEETQDHVPSLEELAQDVEIMVCAKLSAITFTDSAKGKKRLFLLDREDLAKKMRAQPYAIARHFSCYILTHHPFASPGMSSPALGRRYSRDHTSILSGLKRAQSLMLSQHKALSCIQAGLDELSDCYGRFDIYQREGIERKIEAKQTTANHGKSPQTAANLNQAPKPPVEVENKIDAYFRKRDRQIYRLHKSGVEDVHIGQRYGLQSSSVSKIISIQRRKAHCEKVGGDA